MQSPSRGGDAGRFLGTLVDSSWGLVRPTRGAMRVGAASPRWPEVSVGRDTWASLGICWDRASRKEDLPRLFCLPVPRPIFVSPPPSPHPSPFGKVAFGGLSVLGAGEEGQVSVASSQEALWETAGRPGRAHGCSHSVGIWFAGACGPCRSFKLAFEWRFPLVPL